jgi:hypothetical protein
MNQKTVLKSNIAMKYMKIMIAHTNGMVSVEVTQTTASHSDRDLWVVYAVLNINITPFLL